MGHALANSVLEFGIARFCLGIGESGNFPAAIKTVAEWFPQSERSLATGIFNSGTNVGAILAPIAVPWVAVHYGWHAAFLITGAFSATWILAWFFNYHKPAEHPGLSAAELAHINQGLVGSCCAGHPLAQAAQLPPDLGLYIRQVHHRSGLVVLSLLDAQVFQLQLSSGPFPNLVAPVRGLQRIHRGKHLRRLAPRAVSPHRDSSRIGRAWRAMLFCACLVVPIFLRTIPTPSGSPSACSAWPRAPTRDGPPTSSPPSLTCSRAARLASVTGIGGTAGAVGGALIALLGRRCSPKDRQLRGPDRNRLQRLSRGSGHHPAPRARTGES